MDKSYAALTPVHLRCSLCSQCAMFAMTLSCCESLVCGYCTYARDIKCLVCEQKPPKESAIDRVSRGRILEYLRERLRALGR
ncbi:hypothetical protein CGCFRS4_v016131 [Colletotrichum fructicola]|nr:hypothetical protein CGCFRS4_v016131 [Colletotrichum fructicola]